MENEPQNPEFRINPENFHLCILCRAVIYEKLLPPLPHLPTFTVGVGGSGYK